jgi:hypothetical protein
LLSSNLHSAFTPNFPIITFTPHGVYVSTSNFYVQDCPELSGQKRLQGSGMTFVENAAQKKNLSCTFALFGFESCTL